MALDIPNLLNKIYGSSKAKAVKFTAPGYGIDGLIIDAVVSSSSTVSNTITANPVEFGIAITDNVVLNPNQISIHGVISEYSQRFGGLISTGGVVNSIINSVEAGFGGHPQTFSGNRAQRWYGKLIELKELKSGTFFDLFVYPKTYRNLVVQSMTFIDRASLGEAIEFTLIAREVQLATTSIRDPRFYAPNENNPGKNPSTNLGFIPGLGGNIHSFFGV